MSTQECVSLSLSTASTHSHMCKWSAPYHDPHHPALPAAYSEPHYPPPYVVCPWSPPQPREVPVPRSRQRAGEAQSLAPSPTDLSGLSPHKVPLRVEHSSEPGVLGSTMGHIGTR